MNNQIHQSNFLVFLDSYKNYTFANETELLYFLNEINHEFVKNVKQSEHDTWPSYSMCPHESTLCADYYFASSCSWLPYHYVNQYAMSFPQQSVPNYSYTQSLPQQPQQQFHDNQDNFYYDKYSWWKPDIVDQELDNRIQDVINNIKKNPFQSNTTETIAKKTLQSPIKEKQKITIDVRINEFNDLIDLLDKNPYQENVEYNIDLKSLHNIRTELNQINNMIGLKEFKNDLLDQLLYFVQGLHENTEPDYKHLVIYGPPGTGKTHVAKLVGQMYAKLGILKNGVFKKVTRTDLVAGYLGQTAIKTNKVIQECLGGVLFIDEVYSLGCGAGGAGGDDESGAGDTGDSYSKECIDTLCEALSNHKSNLMVIIAGYERDVQRFFFSMNPGLPSRFIWRFTIEKYTANELKRIFLNKVKDNGWGWKETEGMDQELDRWFTNKTNLGTFRYYGRDMEQLFTYCKIAHGRRIYGLPIEEKRQFTITDIDRGYDIFMKHADEKKKRSDLGFRERYCGLYL